MFLAVSHKIKMPIQFARTFAAPAKSAQSRQQAITQGNSASREDASWEGASETKDWCGSCISFKPQKPIDENEASNL